MPAAWTWVHYKVLELAYDRCALAELSAAQSYLGAAPTTIPATSVAETRGALADLVAAGAVALRRGEFASEGALMRYVELSEGEALAVVARDAAWDEDGADAWTYELRELEAADALLAARPPECDPHRPATPS
jgi:hypothetical protein